MNKASYLSKSGDWSELSVDQRKVLKESLEIYIANLSFTKRKTKLHRQLRKLLITRNSVDIFWREMSFYRHAKLISLSGPDFQSTLYLLYSANGQVSVLEETPGQIQAFNEKAGLILNSDSVVDYLKFYFNTGSGAMEDLSIFDIHQPCPWFTRLSTPVRKEIAKYIQNFSIFTDEKALTRWEAAVVEACFMKDRKLCCGSFSISRAGDIKLIDRYEKITIYDAVMQVISEKGVHKLGPYKKDLSEKEINQYLAQSSRKAFNNELYNAFHQERKVVVCKSIQSADQIEIKMGLKRFSNIEGKALPLKRMETDPSITCRKLRKDFPHQKEVIDFLERDLSLSYHFGDGVLNFKPILLNGPPGTSKTSLIKAIAHNFGLEMVYVNCAGDSDNKVLESTDRAWQSGKPSNLIEKLNETKQPNLLVFVDEVDKCGGSDHNGWLVNTLVKLLEKESSCRFHDRYLGAEVDLSHLLFIMVSNTLAGMSGALLSRLTVLECKEIEDQFKPYLLSRVVRDTALSRNIPYAVVQELCHTIESSDDIQFGDLRDARRIAEALIPRWELRYKNYETVH